MKHSRSRRLFKEALRLMPGGVNSPVRAFRAVGGDPLFIRRGKGARIFDEDGNGFIDYVMSWGALLLGHADPAVVAAVREATELGTSFGAPTAAENDLGNVIRGAIPSIQKLRLVSSGTEAAMSAVRLSRAFTKRELIVKFSGHYHGHSDGLLMKAGSGSATLGLPDSAGLPAAARGGTIVCPYNDLKKFKQIVRRHGRRIAAVIMEPVCANMGLVLPEEGFLEEIRKITRRQGIVLIFDEVITGFRLRFGGAQNLLGVEPDLTCLGKIVGGGLPIGVYGGRKEIMDLVSPLGPVYQAGTLSGNPVAVRAGLASLRRLSLRDYAALDARTEAVCQGLAEGLKRKKTAFRINRFGSLFTVFFTPNAVRDFQGALSCDAGTYGRYFRAMLENGVYLPASQFEACFMSFAHTTEDVEKTREALNKAKI